MSPTDIVRNLLILACALGVSACSQILPGLNINVDHGNDTQYRVVKDGAGHYRAEPVHPDSGLPAYRILPVTANLIVAQAQHRAHQRKANAILPALKPGQPPPEYRIGPGDILHITVWDHPELTAPAGTQNRNAQFSGQLVASDGTLYYPFVGTFHAAGMTVEQVRKYLVDHLETYIQNPQIGVRVVSFQADRVEVTGAVMKPGTITLDNTAQGVLQAIDKAGGLDKDASHRRAILIRDNKRYV
ncbi:MAG: polysaccharide biosynthesis/export family protein, partial [Sinobacteraceae bacterium]|nr:polysaccharide biosynthesis/export family protein [Nevskiaceae bacterium]